MHTGSPNIFSCLCMLQARLDTNISWCRFSSGCMHVASSTRQVGVFEGNVRGIICYMECSTYTDHWLHGNAANSKETEQ